MSFFTTSTIIMSSSAQKSSFLSLLCFRPYERGTQQYVWNTDLRAREERVGESGVKSNSEEKFSPETRPFFS